MPDTRKPADTGDAVASIAGSYLDDALDENSFLERVQANPSAVLKDVKAMAASLLRQNER